MTRLKIRAKNARKAGRVVASLAKLASSLPSKSKEEVNEGLLTPEFNAELTDFARSEYRRITGNATTGIGTLSWTIKISGTIEDISLKLFSDYRVAPSVYQRNDSRSQTFPYPQYQEDPDKFNSFIRGRKRSNPFWDELQENVGKKFSEMATRLVNMKIKDVVDGTVA